MKQFVLVILCCMSMQALQAIDGLPNSVQKNKIGEETDFQNDSDTLKEARISIENKFSLSHQSVDRLYWIVSNDSISQYVPAKTPLMLSDKWEEITAPYHKGESNSKFPFRHDKDFSCIYHLVGEHLLLTNVCTFLNEKDSAKIVNRLDSLLPEKFTHEYDELLKENHIRTTSKGTMLITWVDSLDVRNFKCFDRNGSKETIDEFLNRLEVHPYLRLYFKKGVLTNIKFITPKVKEE